MKRLLLLLFIAVAAMGCKKEESQIDYNKEIIGKKYRAEYQHTMDNYHNILHFKNATEVERSYIRLSDSRLLENETLRWEAKGIIGMEITVYFTNGSQDGLVTGNGISFTDAKLGFFEPF